MNISGIRSHFPNLDVKIHGKPLVYLDNGATTFKPQSVIDTINEHYTHGTSNVHRGLHYLSEQATAQYEAVRGKVQSFLNAADESEIVFTSGTTESINIVAQSFGPAFFKEGDEVVITHMEHHSNIVPWQMLSNAGFIKVKVAPVNDRGELIYEEFKALLNERTKLVAMVHISNVTGTINPIEQVIKDAHAVGAKVLIDGAQSVSHQTIDVQALDCDFFAFSSHKLFGPTGVGVLYGKKELLKAMPPIQGGGDMIDHVSFEGTTFAKPPQRFEAGTPNIAGVIGLGAAIDYVQSIGLGAIEEHKNELAEYGRKVLGKIDGLRFIGDAEQKAPIFSFTLNDIHAQDISTMLDENGIAVRTGHHCAEPLMERFGVTSTTRASLSMYNTKEEIDFLAETLKKIQSIFN